MLKRMSRHLPIIIAFLVICFLITSIRKNSTIVKCTTNDIPKFSTNTTSFEEEYRFPTERTMNNLQADGHDIRNKYLFNCTNINQIKIIKREIGGGRSKTIDIGIFHGEKVVIKRISNLKRPNVGYYYRQLLFLKEILMREQLNHPGLINMLGYCVRSIEHDSYIDSYHGEITAVYEYGVAFDASNMSLSVDTRLQHALELADLLVYLKNSPLGDLKIGDFHSRHFLMVKGKINLIDLDYMHNIEYPCGYTHDHKLWCPFHLKCHTCKCGNDTVKSYCRNQTGCKVGTCIGFNAKFNMRYIYRDFFSYFLKPVYFPTIIRSSVARLKLKISHNVINAEVLLKTLISINHNRSKS